MLAELTPLILTFNEEGNIGRGPIVNRYSLFVNGNYGMTGPRDDFTPCEFGVKAAPACINLILT
jgi:hypothetical protein